MHELSIAESILEMVEQAAGEGRMAVSVTLTLGPFSGVCADSLQFWFPEVAEQRGMGRPELVINEVPAKVHCLDCGLDYGTKNVMEGCPQCQSFNRKLLSGREFALESIEVVDE